MREGGRVVVKSGVEGGRGRVWVTCNQWGSVRNAKMPDERSKCNASKSGSAMEHQQYRKWVSHRPNRVWVGKERFPWNRMEGRSRLGVVDNVERILS